MTEISLLRELHVSSSQDKSKKPLFPDKIRPAQPYANILQILVTCVYSSILELSAAVPSPSHGGEEQLLLLRSCSHESCREYTQTAFLNPYKQCFL